MAKVRDAGVKECRETYWMPEYTPKDTDILACFNRYVDHSMDRPVNRPGLLQASRLRDAAQSRKFETFSYLPPLSEESTRAQIQYIIDKGWNPGIEHTEP